MRKLGILLAMAVFFQITQARAQALDGEALLGFYKVYRWNDPGGSAAGNAMRTGYYMGFVAALANSDSGRICAPEAAHAGELYNAVGQFLEAHPRDLGQSAERLVSVALERNFPCTRRQKRTGG